MKDSVTQSYSTLHPFTYMPGYSSLTSQGFHESNTYLIRGEGVWVYDQHNKRYMYATTAVPSVGLCNPYVTDKIALQYATLNFASTCGQTHPLVEQLSQRLIGLCGEPFGQVFYSNDGSGAVETAMRLARQYYLSLGENKRTKFISLEGNYHGTTFGTGSVTHMGINESFGPALENCYSVPTPNKYRPPIDGTYEQVIQYCLDLLEETIFENGPDEIAAVLLEPIQGVNGIIEIPRSYIQKVRRLTERYGILLIMDEVGTGIGRTGGWLMTHELDVSPDLLAVSKGLTGGYFPMGATLVSRAIASQLFDRGGIFLHGSTQSGHPVGCAAAMAVLDCLEQDQLIDQIKPKGEHIINSFRRALSTHPHVGDIRGKGLMIAIEMVSDRINKGAVSYDYGKRLSAALRHEGVLGNWFNSILILYPPLSSTWNEIEVLIDGVVRAIESSNSSIPLE
ncbi:aminotransferase family protein [Paenibacillus kobensis]|uniref:aminotransferase family protein n=1 Tax=Paenibacillus kobensis TaxID=59841 RepID=UPI001FE29A05|nr:aminotransferase class III-fold pyridoxal phosphate-dependent enzyme [Paenibacillus kobensis]